MSKHKSIVTKEIRSERLIMMQQKVTCAAFVMKVTAAHLWVPWPLAKCIVTRDTKYTQSDEEVGTFTRHHQAFFKSSVHAMFVVLSSTSTVVLHFLMPILAAYRNFFSFFLISSYVGFVPVSDVLAIFVSDRR